MASHVPTPHPKAANLTPTQIAALEKQLLLSTSGDTYQETVASKNPFIRRTVVKRSTRAETFSAHQQAGWFTKAQTSSGVLRFQGHANLSAPTTPATPATPPTTPRAGQSPCARQEKSTATSNKTTTKAPVFSASIFESLPQPHNLKGNAALLMLWIERFFDHVLHTLERDPWQFDAVVEALMALLVGEKLKTPLHRVHLTLKNWDDLMATLQALKCYPAPETFPVFCSALLAYYVLVHPEQLLYLVNA